MKYIRSSKYADVYTKVIFLDKKISFSVKYVLGIKDIVRKLFADGTLNECKLNPEKVESFVLKYDENVEVNK